MGKWIEISGDWLTDLLARTEKVDPAFAFASTVNFMRGLSILAEQAVEDPETYLRTTVEPILKKVSPAWSPRKPDEALMGLIFEQVYRAADLANGLALQADYIPAERRPSTITAAIATWYYAMYSLARGLLFSLYSNAPENHTMVAETICNNQTRRLLPDPFFLLGRHLKGMDCELDPVGYPRNARILNVEGPTTPDEAQGAIGAYVAGTWRFFAEAVVDRIKRESKSNRLTPKLQKARDAQVRNAGFMHAAFRYRGKAHYRDGIYTSYGHTSTRGDEFLSDTVRSYQHFAIVAEAIVCRRVSPKWYETYIEDIGKKQRDKMALFPTRWQGPAVLAVVR